MNEEDEDTLEMEILEEEEEDENLTVHLEDRFNKLVPPVEESGVSVDTDDLGKQWLATATDQNNFESTSEPEDDGMHVTRLKPTKR